MEEELITVVVPLYNMAQFLPRAMESLLKQDYRNYEIIIVDDGSTDDGSQLADDYSVKYDIVSCIHKENGGLSSARNVGIDNAKGKYIIFPDPDDWVSEDYLSFLYGMHSVHHTDLEICGRTVVDENGKEISKTKGGEGVWEKSKALCMLMDSQYYTGSACNKIFHLDIIRNNMLYFDTELGMAQDLHFCVRYFMYCEKVVYNPSPKYYYYQHSGGVTSSGMTLTSRKMSGLKTYEKIAEMTKMEYPVVHDMSLATLCNMSLHFLYIYHEKRMHDEEILTKLKQNIVEYGQYYGRSYRFSRCNKILFYIARINPYLYYIVKKTVYLLFRR